MPISDSAIPADWFRGGCRGRRRFIEVIKDIKAIQSRSDRLRSQGKTIVFVPTMGFLHEGHLALLKTGRTLGDDLILSIFVNPTQFGPNEDLDTYPRDLGRDLELASRIGVDAVFTPDRETLYGSNYQTYVNLENLPRHLCGLSRPVFLQGVATVVTKLFNIVKPHIAVFGEKDFQQLTVIRQMVRDLNFDIRIEGVPTVREPDGLAMSSRNAYLSKSHRADALCLIRALETARGMVANGERSAAKIVDAAEARISATPGTRIDYIALCDPETLDNVTVVRGPTLMALAVTVGQTRLIDNMILDPPGSQGI
jgi:pantoate--beta-alanine ligase